MRGLFIIFLFLAFPAFAEPADTAVGHVSATVCQPIKMDNGFTTFDCGERTPSDEDQPPDPRGFPPAEPPEKVYTIIDTGEEQ